MDIICLNGEFLSLEDARLSPLDSGFLLGDGVFETMRAEDGHVLFLAEHLARLSNGLKTLALPCPIVSEELLAWTETILDANGLSTARLRLSVSRGPMRGGPISPREGEPTVLLTAFSLNDNELAQARTRGWRVLTASFPRNHHSPLSRIKSLSYSELLMARREALSRGVNAALMLNTEGAVAELDMANIFVVRGDVILTPSVEEGALPGIMRGRVLRVARQLGYEVRETRLMPEDLIASDECFATNSIMQVMPVVEIDGTQLGEGAPGQVTRHIYDSVRDLIKVTLSRSHEG